MSKIDLIWLGSTPPPAWPLGATRTLAATPAAIAAFTAADVAGSRAEAWLFWDEALGPPDPAAVAATLGRPGDVWHAGLRLGLAGQPWIVDHIEPTVMFNADAPADRESTSWRLSLRCALVRTEVLRQLGGPVGAFRTLDGAGLELGHRFIRWGAIVRHRPELLGGRPAVPAGDLPLEDVLRWARCSRDRFWINWSIWRALVTGRLGPLAALRARRVALAMERPRPPAPYRRPAPTGPIEPLAPDVAVLIPTVDRYPYLLTLLDQLRRQTVPPAEIVVIDQTAPDRRSHDLVERFPDLPLKYYTLDQPGQCSSRNLGLRDCRRAQILFIDDDDEVDPDLIERHLRCLAEQRAEVSSGVTREADGSALPEEFKRFRASDVFPTNNTMVRREALRPSGLFDLAYDRGSRADGDLGMRVSLSGAMMVLDPANVVLHHHAPSGGLRKHKARKITRDSSLHSLWQRHLPSPTEIYLGLRYFRPDQVREMLAMRVMQTYRVRGGAGRRLLKGAIATAQLPSTLLRIRANRRRALAMLQAHPTIGRFSDDPPPA